MIEIIIAVLVTLVVFGILVSFALERIAKINKGE